MFQFKHKTCDFKKVSNLFELMVVSSNDKRFNEWLKCFEVLFDVTADQIMADYNDLVSLVNVTTTRYLYEGYDSQYDINGVPRDSDGDYDWITLLPNRH